LWARCPAIDQNELHVVTLNVRTRANPGYLFAKPADRSVYGRLEPCCASCRCHPRAAGPVGEAGPAVANAVRGRGSNRARNSPCVQHSPA
jgi:hypothetical protein